MADSRDACVGWPADPPCPKFGVMHGCASVAGHDDEGVGRAKQHRCACGAVAKPENYRTLQGVVGGGRPWWAEDEAA